MYRHPSSAYPWQDRCPDHKSTFPVGWGEGRCLPEQAQGASVLPGSVLQQLLSTWRVLSSQELGNKLGPLGWGGGTLQTALPPPETLCGPRGDLFHPNDANLPTPGAAKAQPPPHHPRALLRKGRPLSVGPALGREAAVFPGSGSLLVQDFGFHFGSLKSLFLGARSHLWM